MYIPNIEKFRTPEHNRRIERCNKASGPVLLKPGIHVKQLRAYPDDMDAAIENFYATMQTQYPNFEVLSINTNMTFGAMLAHITFRV